MSVLPSPASHSAIVTRLRAAGCVFAEDEARLLIRTARTPADLDAMVDRRVASLPLEHVLGWAEFCGLRIAVDSGVFVPRRRTEFLIHQATALAHQATAPTGQGTAPTGQATAPTGQGVVRDGRAVGSGGQGSGSDRERVVVDLCCGSGALGVALAAALGRVELHAADIDPVAVRCARHNVAAVGGQVYEGDLYEPLPTALRGRIDILVANVPYVPTEAVGLLPPEARVHEARVALDGGADGLDVLRRVAAEAPRWLTPGGHLLFETSERQVPQAVAAIAGGGLAPRVVVSDELDATVVIATRPAAQSPLDSMTATTPARTTNSAPTT
ncbi:release factor glutamine methyltransferase [Thermomonospora echinospora]|uniref:Release factor glutamine methyltransferase n=1 Tax=Thermomonospora echinospora TaxID=1992 RepID=A0A1H6CTV2_9ACTN|nr:putative protein N(5)-glutamine methyltransferase [Thermomonospora echinospora]SEG76509.1 release factor glutamine methyltransferase [Thermomonospora echinospora]